MPEDYISVCNKFLQVLSEISKDENKDKERPEVLETLNCIRLDFDCHLKVRFAQHGGHGDKSWFYCYAGEHDSYVNAYEDRTKKSSSFFTCYNYDEIYNVFNHLLIEPSPMGAWQAYLISRLGDSLPMWWHANYGKRDYIYSKEDIGKITHFIDRKFDASVLLNYDIAPKLYGENERYYVSCCYWTDFGGLKREFVEIQLLGNQLYQTFVFDEKTIHEYQCGIMF